MNLKAGSRATACPNTFVSIEFPRQDHWRLVNQLHSHQPLVLLIES